MSGRNFRELLEAKWASGKFVCVGLDSEVMRIPAGLIPANTYVKFGHLQVVFNRAIVEATKDLVCAYKPNAAFYEAYGAEGVRALRYTSKTFILWRRMCP